MKEWNSYQFIDYIYGGMTCNLFLAIDFTEGNKPFHDPFSLHYMNPREVEDESSDAENHDQSMM